MGLAVRKPVFRVSYNTGFKPVSSSTETSKKNEILPVANFHMYDTFQEANIKGHDQTAHMHRLV